MAAIHREVVAHLLKFQGNAALREQRLSVVYKNASEAALWKRCFVEVGIENVDFLELEPFLSGRRTEGGSYAVVVLNNCLNSVVRTSGDEFDADKLAELLKALLYVLEHDGLVLCRQNLGSSRRTLSVFNLCYGQAQQRLISDGFRQRFAAANLTDVFDQYKSKLDGKTLGFKFLALESLQASVHSCQNWMDLLWCLKKAEFSVDEPVGLITDRHFLDKNQYATAGIAAYEWIFGENFISPGFWLANDWRIDFFSQWDNNGPRTTNHAEENNNALSAHFRQGHPSLSIWLVSFQKYHQLLNGAPPADRVPIYVRNDNELLAAKRQFEYTTANYNPHSPTLRGAEKNLEFLNKLSLRPGARLLDIGCGIGGTLFQAAKEFGVYAHGVDLSSNMVSLAYEKANKLKDTRISLVVGDVLSYEFQANSFDAVYSRDCIQHIANTKQLFDRCYSWLKPGGKMLFTSYMLGRGSPSGRFNDYVDQRRYTLLPSDEFAQNMENAGFCNVAAADLTEQLKMITEKEMKKTTDNSAEFNKLFTEKRYEQLVFGWAAKLGFIDSANLIWGVVYAEKPLI